MRASSLLLIACVLVAACGKTSSEAKKQRAPRRVTGPSASDCGTIFYDRTGDDVLCSPGHVRQIDCFMAAARECRRSTLVTDTFAGEHGVFRITFRVEEGCRVTWETDDTRFKPGEAGRDRHLQKYPCRQLHEHERSAPSCSDLRCWDDE